MQASVKLWVHKIQGKPIPALSLIKDFDYLKMFLHRLQPQFFQIESTSTYDGLIQQIIQYYKKQQKLDVSGSMKMARKDSDMLQLWVLVLGIAIRCKERNQNIQLILNLDEKTQSSLMGFISRIDDTLAACLSLQMQSSKRQNTNLQRHLLDTIDQISQQNSQLKNKIQQMQDEFSTYKSNKQSMIQTLESQLTQLHSQRLEVLSQYYGVYNTDNIYTIFKSLENENINLKGVLEKKEEIMEQIEKEGEDLRIKIDRLLDSNKSMKLSLVNLEAIQAQVQEQQVQIQQLRKSENDHLQQIFKLEKGHSPNKLQRRLIRHNTMEPIQQEEPNPVRGSQSYKPVINKTDSPQRLIRSIRKKGSVLSKQLEPYQRQKQNLQAIKQLQQIAKSLSVKLQSVNEEVATKSAEIKYQSDRYKQLEQKLKHVQIINEIYISNIKEKENTIVEKNEQYETRFSMLMDQIEALRSLSQENDLSKVQHEVGFAQKLNNTNQKYQQKIRDIMVMLQDQLISFRNKELQYLQAIRQLKLNKGADLLNSNIQIGKSVFAMERSKISNEQSNIIEQQKGGIKCDIKQELLLRKESRLSRLSSEESRLNIMVKELQLQVSNMHVLNGDIQQKLDSSIQREKMSLIEITRLHQEILKLRLQLGSARQNMIKYLEQQIVRLKFRESSPHQCSQIQQRIRRLQELSQEIQQIKSKSEAGAQGIEAQKELLLLFLKQQLKLLVGNQIVPVQTVQSQPLDSTRDLAITVQGQMEAYTKIDTQKYVMHKQLQQQLHSKTQQIRILRQTNIKLQSQLANLKQKIAISQLDRQNLTYKTKELQLNLLNTQSKSIQHYGQITHLLHQIQTCKEHQLRNEQLTDSFEDGVTQNHPQNHPLSLQSKSQFGISLKRTNQKLVRQLQKLTHCFALFRNRYAETLQKYRNLQQQHTLLLSTFADLVVNLS